MPDANQKLAESLAVLRALQVGGSRVFETGSFTSTHRQRLARNGFLQPIVKGWWVSTSPTVRAGDSSPWFATFWEFCVAYATHRYGDSWHLSAEHSLLRLAGSTVIPAQVAICAPDANNQSLGLPFNTSLFARRDAMPAERDIVVVDGVRMLAPSPALLKVSDQFFKRWPLEAQIVLAMESDVADLLRRLLEGGHSHIAGRIVGALRHVGRAADADRIIETMRASEFDVRERDPFEPTVAVVPADRTTPPVVMRLRALWERHRAAVIATFPSPPGAPADHDAYLSDVTEAYGSDAYNSLSIEGYEVSAELIERVRSRGWNPESEPGDRLDRDALAARGYWQAFQVVRRDVGRVLAGSAAGTLLERTHHDWYRELFQPFVVAGALPASTLAGYRTIPVYLRGSRHVPPRWETVRDAMPELFALLAAEPEPAVRAVLGHWLVGYVHPYPDGNGRIARFLMNVMLASGGYPWTIIPADDRDRYLSTLDALSVDDDPIPFAKLLAERVAAPR